MPRTVQSAVAEILKSQRRKERRNKKFFTALWYQHQTPKAQDPAEKVLSTRGIRVLTLEGALIIIGGWLKY